MRAGDGSGTNPKAGFFRFWKYTMKNWVKNNLNKNFLYFLPLFNEFSKYKVQKGAVRLWTNTYSNTKENAIKPCDFEYPQNRFWAPGTSQMRGSSSVIWSGDESNSIIH